MRSSNGHGIFSRLRSIRPSIATVPEKFRKPAKTSPALIGHKYQATTTSRLSVVRGDSAVGSAILSVEELGWQLESFLNRAKELDMLITLPHTSSQSERMLTSEIRKFLPSVEAALDNGSAQHIVSLYSLYELAYRLGYKLATSKELLPRLFTRAITLWLKGDKSVGEGDLIAMLQYHRPTQYVFQVHLGASAFMISG